MTKTVFDNRAFELLLNSTNLHDYNWKKKQLEEVYFQSLKKEVDEQEIEKKYRDCENYAIKGSDQLCGVDKFKEGDRVLYLKEAYRIVCKHDRSRYVIKSCKNNDQLNVKGEYLTLDTKNMTIDLPGVINTGTIPMADKKSLLIDSNPMLADMAETFTTCLDLSTKKNADYAGDADPFKNFKGSTHVGVDPARAILVRMMDKMARIGNLIDKDAQVKSESIDDTLMDVINYASILKSYIKRNSK